MSNNTTNTTNPTQLQSPEPLTPEAVAEQLRAMIPAIPGYVQLPKATARSRQSAARVDPQFIESAFAAIEASDPVRNGVGATSEELRTEADEASRWTAVRELLREMLKGVDTAILTRKHRVGSAALQAYGIAKAVSRRPDQSHLLVHIDSMKRWVRVGRKAKKDVATPAPQPVPAPTPQPHTEM